MTSLEQAYCHICGHGLPEKARFCPSCGTQKLARPPLLDDASSTRTEKPPEAPHLPQFYSLALQFTHRIKNLWTSSKQQYRWGIGIAAVLLLLLLAFGRNSGLTAQEFIDRERAKLEQELNTPGNKFAKYIEEIHLTVTFKGAAVKSMSVKTVNGSNTVGSNGENVSEMEIVIAAYWDGYVQKDGFTEVKLVYEPQRDRLKTIEHLASSAWVNTETIDWYKVGYAVGKMLAL